MIARVSKREKRRGAIGKPAHRITSLRTVNVFLIVLFALACLLLVQSIGRENILLFGINHFMFKMKLLSVDASIALFTTIIGLFFLERQFSKSLMPLIQTSMDDKAISDTSEPTKSIIHKCYLRNSGSGRAIINTVRYRLIFLGDKDHNNYDIDHFELLERLKVKGLQEGIDFYMPRIAENCSFVPPDSSREFHSSNENFGRKVKYLDMNLVYSNILGVKWTKDFPILYHHRADIITNESNEKINKSNTEKEDKDLSCA